VDPNRRALLLHWEWIKGWSQRSAMESDAAPVYLGLPHATQSGQSRRMEDIQGVETNI